MTTTYRRPMRLLALFVMLLLVLITLFPIYWVVRTSLLPKSAIFSNPGSLLPSTVTLSNYGRLFGLYDSATAQKMGGVGLEFNFLRYLSHTIFVATIITLTQVLFSAAGAYAFARLHFPLRKQIFGLYLGALMVPGIVMTIPNFILVKDLGWLNSFMGIMAPSLLMSPFTVFFLRQFFISISRELEEAAYIDGAGKFMVFFRIIVPLSTAPLGTISIITFINIWSDYMWPLLVGSSDKVRMLTVALGIFRQQAPATGPDWGGLMAGAALSMLPILLLFMIFGKKVLNSIGFSGFR
jgi:multiple sugar transport system permease protein